MFNARTSAIVSTRPKDQGRKYEYCIYQSPWYHNLKIKAISALNVMLNVKVLIQSAISVETSGDITM